MPSPLKPTIWFVFFSFFFEWIRLKKTHRRSNFFQPENSIRHEISENLIHSLIEPIDLAEITFIFSVASLSLSSCPQSNTKLIEFIQPLTTHMTIERWQCMISHCCWFTPLSHSIIHYRRNSFVELPASISIQRKFIEICIFFSTFLYNFFLVRRKMPEWDRECSKS